MFDYAWQNPFMLMNSSPNWGTPNFFVPNFNFTNPFLAFNPYQYINNNYTQIDLSRPIYFSVPQPPVRNSIFGFLNATFSVPANLSSSKPKTTASTNSVFGFLNSSASTHSNSVPVKTTTDKAEDVKKTRPHKSAKKALHKNEIVDLACKTARKYGVDERLVLAVIDKESRFNPNAVSHCGAQGLMQLMPKTAESLGVTDPFDPKQNIEGGVKYLKRLLGKYNGDIKLALAAYNAGEGNVAKYHGIPPFEETQDYVSEIYNNYQNYEVV